MAAQKASRSHAVNGVDEREWIYYLVRTLKRPPKFPGSFHVLKHVAMLKQEWRPTFNWLARNIGVSNIDLNHADKTQKYTKPVESIPHGFV